jgi:hypothetical protein
MSKSRILKSTPYKNTTLSGKVIHALASGKGITWLDHCRIPLRNTEDLSVQRNGDRKLDINNMGWDFKAVTRDNKGRFPANLICSDDILNDGIERRSGGSSKYHEGGDSSWFGKALSSKDISDSGSYSRYFDLDRWWEEL